jgi:hypothetical protein
MARCLIQRRDNFGFNFHELIFIKHNTFYERLKLRARYRKFIEQFIREKVVASPIRVGKLSELTERERNHQLMTSVKMQYNHFITEKYTRGSNNRHMVEDNREQGITV